MEKLKVLVLGTGFFGKNWLRELSACGDCEVAGLVGKHPEILAAAGEEFGVPAARRFATVSDGLDRAGAQAVVVALPEMVHKEAILAALGRGLHVLTEKPLAMTMAEAREIVRAARQRSGVGCDGGSELPLAAADEDAAAGGPRRTDRERSARSATNTASRSPAPPPMPGARRCRTRSCTTWPLTTSTSCAPVPGSSASRSWPGACALRGIGIGGCPPWTRSSPSRGA